MGNAKFVSIFLNLGTGVELHLLMFSKSLLLICIISLASVSISGGLPVKVVYSIGPSWEILGLEDESKEIICPSENFGRCQPWEMQGPRETLKSSHDVTDPMIIVTPTLLFYSSFYYQGPLPAWIRL